MLTPPPPPGAHTGCTGQATVEFSLVIGLVLLMLFGALETGFYAIERGASVSAAEKGALMAAGVGAAGLDQPNLVGADTAMSTEVQHALIGATVTRHAPANGVCPALDTTWPTGTVYVCSAWRPGLETVEVSIRGWVPALVPPTFGLGTAAWRPGALPIDVDDVVHTAVFAA